MTDPLKVKNRVSANQTCVPTFVLTHFQRNNEVVTLSNRRDQNVELGDSKRGIRSNLWTLLFDSWNPVNYQYSFREDPPN